jgi:Tol biopolymer transport system component
VVVYTAATPSFGPDSYSLFTAGADGTGSVELTTSGPDWEGEAVWSPDGKRVAFTRVAAPDHVYSAVWVVNADGTDARSLSGPTSYAEFPKWSPDGRWIAYQEQTDYGSGGGRADTTFGLWIVRPDGTGRRKLASGGTGGSSMDFVGQGSAWGWSPDGTRIALISQKHGSDDPFAVYVVNVGTRRSRFLTYGMYPAWSPDSKRIVFSAGDTHGYGCSGVWLIPASGGKRQHLLRTPAGACDTDLAWSPDGRWIAFTRSSDPRTTSFLVTNTAGRFSRATPILAASVRWPVDCSHLFIYKSAGIPTAGWIIPGAHGKPRFVQLPHQFDGGDWHC